MASAVPLQQTAGFDRFSGRYALLLLLVLVAGTAALPPAPTRPWLLVLGVAIALVCLAYPSRRKPAVRLLAEAAAGFVAVALAMASDRGAASQYVPLLLVPVVLAARSPRRGAGAFAAVGTALSFLVQPLLDSGLDLQWRRGMLWTVMAAFSGEVTASLLRERDRRKPSDRLLAAVLGAASDHSIIATDPSGTIRVFNSAAERLLGYNADEMIGLHTPEIIHDPAEVARVAAELGVEPGFDALVGGAEESGGVTRLWTYLRKDGSAFEVELTVSAIVGSHGEVTGYLGIAKDITAQQAALHALAASEELLRLLVDGTRDFAIFMLGPDGRIQSWNLGAERINGYAAHEAIGLHFSVFYPEAEVNAGHPERELEQARENGSYAEEGWRVRKDGSTFWAGVVITVLRADDGALRGYSKVTRDLSERWQAQNALVASEESMRRLADASSGGVAILDGAGLVVEANRALAEMFRYDVADLIGKPALDLVMPEDRDLVRSRWANEISEAAEVRGLRSDGTAIEVLASSREIDSGGIWRRVSSLQDLTALRAALKDLDRADGRFRVLVDHAPLGITESDPQGKRLFANARWAELFGVAADDALDADVVPLVEASVREGVRARWQQAMQSGQEFDDLVPIRTHAGIERWLQVRSRPLVSATGAVESWISTFEDVSDRVAAEQTSQRHGVELERSNQDLLEFASAASHDLKAPLVSIGGFGQLLEQRYASVLDDAGREYLGYVTEGVERLSSLIDDLLAYAQVGQSTPPVDVDLNAVLAQVVQGLRAALSESGGLVVLPELPVVHGNLTQMTQLFQNLLSNSLKFRSEHPPQISVSVAQEGDRYVFLFEDNGIGIDLRYAHQVFGMFQRLHSRAKYPGTGVGLALCRRIVERHGGTIEVVSQAPPGTVFRFTLPAAGCASV